MTYRIAAAAACLALFACKGGEPTDEPTPSQPTPDCESVSDQFPGDGAAGVYYRTAFSWSFTAVDDSASVALTGPDGPVTGSGEFVGNTFVWEADEPLAPSTTYDLTLSFCDGEQNPTSQFTTSDVGASTDAALLADKSFVLDLQDPGVNFIEPPGVGGLLQSQLAGVNVLVGVVSADATNIQMRGAIANDANPPVQEECTESIPFPSANFTENPYFEIGPETTTITVADVSVQIQDLKISGAFNQGATEISGAVLEGNVDTRPLVDSLAPGAGDSGVCDLVGQFGVNCVDCGGGEVFCLSLKVNNINAAELPGTVVAEVTPADIAGNAACDP